MEPHLEVVELVVDDLPRALAFYRRLGVAVPDEPDASGHVDVALAGGLRLAFDTADVIRSFDPGWIPPAGGGHRMALAFACDSPAEVDRVVAELEASGSEVHLAPFDAPWGMRYATVHDPDGNSVDLFAAL